MTFPCVRLPILTWIPPKYIIKIIAIFINKKVIGFKNDVIFAILTASFWYSIVLFSKRFISLSSLLKAFITLAPVKFSLLINVKSSSFFCTSKYFFEDFFL